MSTLKIINLIGMACMVGMSLNLMSCSDVGESASLNMATCSSTGQAQVTYYCNPAGTLWDERSQPPSGSSYVIDGTGSEDCNAGTPVNGSNGDTLPQLYSYCSYSVYTYTYDPESEV